MVRNLCCWTLGMVLMFLSAMPAQAYHLPKWELGVGMAALRLPSYRGANDVKNYLLPFPYLTYRGERLRVDEEGIRSKLVERRRFRMDFSLAGNVPVQDSDVAARTGMPGLDPVGEIGPTLDWSLWKRNDYLGSDATELWLRLPMRAAFSVGDPLLAHQGWVFSPSLDLVHRRGSAGNLRRVALSLGPLYASQAYHQYFYEVTPEFVTGTRDLYQAQGGYSGSRITLSVSLNKQKWFFGGFARYDNLSQAVFADSPLVETKSYLAIGIAVSRIFAASTQAARDQ